MPRVPKIGKWLPPNTFCACLGRPPCLRGGIDDTRVARRCLAWETRARYSDVDDHAHLMAPVALHDARLVKGDGLGEGLRPRRTPRAHAHVGVHVELLPARGGCWSGGREAGALRGWRVVGTAWLRSPNARRVVGHCRPPNRLWRTARIAGPAVSDLRIRGPTPTTLKPWASAVSTSRRDSPPSGPIRRCTCAPTGRVGGRL